MFGNSTSSPLGLVDIQFSVEVDVSTVKYLLGILPLQNVGLFWSLRWIFFLNDQIKRNVFRYP